MTAGLGLAAWLVLAAAGPSSGTSLERLAVLVAARATEARAEAPVGVFVRAESPELSRALATLVCAQLSRAHLAPVPIPAEASDEAQAERWSREHGHRSLLRLGLSLENGAAVVRGDLIGTWVNFWSGQSPTRPAHPAAAIDASTDADAQALVLASAHLPPPVRPPATSEWRLSATLFAKVSAPVAAIAAGDLTGDGRAEVVALTDEEVIVFGPDGRVWARRELRALPSAAAPCRDPVGAVVVLANPPRIAYFSAQRARGELLLFDRLRSELRPVGLLDAVPLGVVGDDVAWGQWLPGQNQLANPFAFQGRPLAAPGPFTTLAVRSTGTSLLLAYALPNGTCSVARGANPAVPLPNCGAALAWADLAGDGALQGVVSAGAYQPEREELRVIDASAPTHELARIALDPTRALRVVSLAAASLDSGAGGQALIAAAWTPDGTSELFAVRKVAP